MDYAIEQIDPKNTDYDSTSILIEFGEDVSLKYQKPIIQNNNKKENYDRYGFSLEILEEIKESNTQKDFKLYIQ